MPTKRLIQLFDRAEEAMREGWLSRAIPDLPEGFDEEEEESPVVRQPKRRRRRRPLTVGCLVFALSGCSAHW